MKHPEPRPELVEGGRFVATRRVCRTPRYALRSVPRYSGCWIEKGLNACRYLFA
jgi:hypothetical protein